MNDEQICALFEQMPAALFDSTVQGIAHSKAIQGLTSGAADALATRLEGAPSKFDAREEVVEAMMRVFALGMILGAAKETMQ